MTPPSPPELFVSERPLRSDFARERVYARRRKITVAIVMMIVGGIFYAFHFHRAVNPAEPPTLHAEPGDYKQKPADPGGIDIPHQDMRVYDELENKNGAPVAVEHLLPPPETPQDAPPAAPSTPPAAVAPAVTSAPPVGEKAEIIAPTAPPSITTTVTPASPASTPAPSPPAAPTKEITLEQVIANTQTASPTTPAIKTLAAGKVMIQLASVPDQGKAQSLAQNLQSQFAALLGGVTLQVHRADLGGKGIFYRIQSQPMNESDATRLCAAIKQQHTGCLLVRE